MTDKQPKEADSVTGSTSELSSPCVYSIISASTLVTGSADCGHNIVFLSKSEKNGELPSPSLHSSSVITLDVDKRIPVSELKQWLSEKLKIDADQFQLCTHHTVLLPSSSL